MAKPDPNDPFTRDPSKPGPGARSLSSAQPAPPAPPAPLAPPAPPLESAKAAAPPASAGGPQPPTPPPPTGAPLAPRPNQGTSKDWMGIVSLVTAILGMLLLAVIFGILGLNAARRGEASNRGLSIAGLAVSGAWVVAGVVLFAAAMAIDASRTGERTDPLDLAVGDCVFDDGLGSGDDGEVASVYSVWVVPCTEPHRSEVYAVIPAEFDAYPGDLEFYDAADAACLDSYLENVSVEDEQFLPYYSWFAPDRESWRFGERRYVCLASVAPGAEPVSGPVLNP